MPGLPERVDESPRTLELILSLMYLDNISFSEFLSRMVG